MAALQSWDIEYLKEVESLESLVEEASLANGKEQDKLISDIEKQSERMKTVKKSFGLGNSKISAYFILILTCFIEIKMIKDKTQKAEYEKKAKDYDVRLTTSISKLEVLRSGKEKKELMVVGNKNYNRLEGKDNDQLLEEASKIQDDTMSSLARTKNMVEASKDIGQSTLDVLYKQREQIAEIDHEISAMDGNLKRAQVLVKGFSKRLAGDRIIQGFVALNIILLVVVVIYVVVTGKSLASNSSANPADPTSGDDVVDDAGSNNDGGNITRIARKFLRL